MQFNTAGHLVICSGTHAGSSIAHRMTITSFAITLCGHCCRRHVVEQSVASVISVVRIVVKKYL